MGDKSARYENMVRAHQGVIRAFLRRLTNNHAEADDLAQDTFIKAYDNFDAVEDFASIKPWLFQIAYRTFLDSYRKARRRESLAVGMEDPATETPGPSGAAMDIAAAMTSLPPDMRAAVMLCLSYGMTHSEAAAALSMPLGTVKSHVNRGRERLKASLGAYEKV